MGLVDTSRVTEALHAAIERFAESTDGCRAVDRVRSRGMD